MAAAPGASHNAVFQSRRRPNYQSLQCVDGAVIEVSNQAVAAVMVTFRPDDDVLTNIVHLARQFSKMVIVDNGSSAESLGALRDVQKQVPFELVSLSQNRGLGAGLNEGIRAAKGLGCSLVCLFDQDGRIADGFLEAMLGCFAAQPRTSVGGVQCGTLIPAYVDRNTGNPLPPIFTPAGPAANRIEAAMTAGSLMAMEVLDTVGLFDESFFIDGTDFDLSLRMRRRGFFITQCREAVLHHAPGKRKDVLWFGKTVFTLSNYSPARRYYAVRNSTHLVKCNAFAFWPLSWFLISNYAKEAVKVLGFETHKLASIAAMVHGLWDGLRGRLGYTVKL